jgi:hypothetical protein
MHPSEGCFASDFGLLLSACVGSKPDAMAKDRVPWILIGTVLGIFAFFDFNFGYSLLYEHRSDLIENVALDCLGYGAHRFSFGDGRRWPLGYR